IQENSECSDADSSLKVACLAYWSFLGLMIMLMGGEFSLVRALEGGIQENSECSDADSSLKVACLAYWSFSGLMIMLMGGEFSLVRALGMVSRRSAHRLMYSFFPSPRFFPVGFSRKAKFLGLTQENQEAVKECYKEYIGMVKVHYEEAQRSKHGRPEENVVGTCSGTAWKREPQAFAGMRSVKIVDTPEDRTPKGTAQVDVKDESNSKGTTNNDLEDYTSSSDDFINGDRGLSKVKEHTVVSGGVRGALPSMAP
nr:hypothetical protein [Tanacetum cinerariifolium]